MVTEKSPYVCPAAFAGSLDNFLRRIIHKPEKLLAPYVKKGMRVLDLGCGPGYFTSALISLAEKEGNVVAADIQQDMLNKMLGSVRKNGFDGRAEAHLCPGGSIGVSGKFDFVLAFWMVHEVPDQKKLFNELRSLLNPGGMIWVIEPKIHVTAKAFGRMLSNIGSAGLNVTGTPTVPLSRSVLLSAGEIVQQRVIIRSL